MNLILLFLFLLPSSKVGFPASAEQKIKHASCDTAISETERIRESMLIDTNLHFNNVKEIAKYKHQKDSIFRAFIPQSKIQKDIKEKLEYDN